MATEHDSIYAFAAGNPNGGKPLWKKSLIDPAHGITTVSSAALDCTDLVPEIGITGTPVIDPTTETLYVVLAAFKISAAVPGTEVKAEYGRVPMDQPPLVAELSSSVLETAASMRARKTMATAL